MPKIIEFKVQGDFKRLNRYLLRARKDINRGLLEKYGKRGVEALSSATPVDSGLTADSWYYEIQNEDDVAVLRFCNSNLGDGWCPISIILQYGHATGTGGWVEGRDYINPAIQPLFEELVQEAWKEVTRA